MTRYGKKCDTYITEVEANKKIIKFNKIIIYGPLVFLSLLGLILLIATAVMKAVSLGGSFAFLIFIVVGIVYSLTIYYVLNKKFETNNITIIKKFCDFYKVPNNADTAIINRDNKGLAQTINKYGANTLFVYIINDELMFVTTGLVALKTTTLKTIGNIDNFEKYIKKDFASLIIPIDDIDNYKNNEKEVSLMVAFKDSVLKIIFNSEKFLDNLIPTKDFYFNADKK